MIRHIFSFAPYYGVISAILVICMGLGYFPTDAVSNPVKAVVFIALVLIALITIISSVAAVFNHLDHLSEVRDYKGRIKNHEEHIEQIKESIKMITEKAGEFDAEVMAKSNVDHPIVKAMHRLTDAQDKLRDCKNTVADYKARISARESGPFGWVVKTYGAE